MRQPSRVALAVLAASVVALGLGTTGCEFGDATKITVPVDAAPEAAADSGGASDGASPADAGSGGDAAHEASSGGDAGDAG